MLLCGDHLERQKKKFVSMLEQDRLTEMRRKRLTLAVLQGLAGRCRVVDSERSQSRKLRTGADEWAVHTSALWGILATVSVLMSSIGLTGVKPCQDFPLSDVIYPAEVYGMIVIDCNFNV
jgi:hypothetical protein